MQLQFQDISRVRKFIHRIKELFFTSSVISITLYIMLMLNQISIISLIRPRLDLVVIHIISLYFIHSTSLTFIFILGLVQDVIYKSPIGMHSFSYLVVVYLTHKYSRRLLNSTIYNSIIFCLITLILLFLETTIVFIIQNQTNISLLPALIPWVNTCIANYLILTCLKNKDSNSYQT